MTLRTAWSAASVTVRLLVGAIVLLVVIVAVWAVVGAWNGYQRGRTAKAMQKIERTTGQAQSSLDEQVHTKEVETIIREPVIIERTVRQATEIREVPAGRQLGPTLDALCVSRLYEADPDCAGRVQGPGAGAEDVRGGPAAPGGG
jgi:hypothetical protein